MSLHPDIAAVIHGDSEGCIVHGDCLEIMADMPDGCVDAVVTDHPYNIGKAAWDKIPNYLEWCELWIAAASKGCKRQGAFWCFHSEPDVLVVLSRMIAKHGRPRQNWVTWDKYNGNSPGVQYIMNRSKIGRPDGNDKRTFDKDAEYIVYHADDGQWTAQSDECRGFIFEPLRAYLAGEWSRAGLNAKDANDACGNQMAGHYMTRSQWALPTAANYAKLQARANAQGGNYLRREYDDLHREYDDLRREYDDLHREYEHLRPTFNNPGKVSSVWQYPPAKANGHATPKPVKLMQRIIETTTNIGDVVLEPFAGSGTTLVAAKKLGRRWIGIEIDERYCEIARNRVRDTPRPLFTAPSKTAAKEARFFE